MAVWKEYTNDKRYLIALLPGLEISMKALQVEIDDIRAAIADGQDRRVKTVGPAPEVKVRKKGRPKVQKLLEAAPLIPANLPQKEFIVEVVRFLGGKATNLEIRKAIPNFDPMYSRLSDRRALSVAMAGIVKDKMLKRIGRGLVRLP